MKKNMFIIGVITFCLFAQSCNSKIVIVTQEEYAKLKEASVSVEEPCDCLLKSNVYLTAFLNKKAEEEQSKLDAVEASHPKGVAYYNQQEQIEAAKIVGKCIAFHEIDSLVKMH